MPTNTLRPALALSALIVAAASCSKSPTQPDPAPQEIQVTAISPAVGATTGGTPVTITGSGFASGASVTIGGVAATNVSVSSSTTLTAVAGARTAGTGDVIVSHLGRQAVLPNAFTYVVPSAGPNHAPAIDDLVAQGGARPRQPAFMADLGETLAVQATVSDTETSLDALTYEWTATAGSFSGAGASVTWRAPAGLASTPVTATLTLTVVERYLEFENSVPVPREHRVAVSRDVRVHNSIEEVATKARNFLLAFSNSSVPTAEVMRDFSPNCGGTADEEFDVARNRCTFIIDDFFVGDATTTIDFGGTCPFRSRPADACAVVPVRWESTVRADANSCPLNEVTLTPGARETAEGLDQVTAVYEAGEWRLCGSDFLPANASPTGVTFKRE